MLTPLSRPYSIAIMSLVNKTFPHSLSEIAIQADRDKHCPVCLPEYGKSDDMECLPCIALKSQCRHIIVNVL